MLFEHGLFLRDGFGDIFAEDGGHDFPEPILRMPVVECHFPRLGRGNRAEHEHLRFAVVQGREFVGDAGARGFAGGLFHGPKDTIFSA